MQNYEILTTDELLEMLPNHLHLARNENAEHHDRWRIYNRAHKKYLDPGTSTARELLIATYIEMEEAR